MNKTEKGENQASCDSLDQSVLDGLRALESSGSIDLLSRVINLYLSSSIDLVRLLEAACDSGECEKIEQYAHGLKSSCNNVGALSLGHYLESLEAEARNGMIKDVNKSLTTILHEYDRVTAALTQELVLKCR
ncbi:MAG: Hpt domain-containing protein [Gammaproteobacteria bacterium]|nr:Hpt domain-containing protein [Gammaproteobacteria bacterium]